MRKKLDLSKGKKTKKSKKSIRISRSERLARNKENREAVRLTGQIIYRLCVLNVRSNYYHLFSNRLVTHWTIYEKEIKFALNCMHAHEKKFLEDCFIHKLTYDKMFISRSTYYRCLTQYSRKFLSLFDYELYHNHLAEIYDSVEDLDTPPVSST